MEQYIENFRRWLKILNYAKSTVYSNPKYIKDFIDYLEAPERSAPVRSAPVIKTIQDIENRHIIEYYEYLKVRPNKRKPGALSQNYIISNIDAIKRFAKFLRETHGEHITVNIKPGADLSERIQSGGRPMEITVLTAEEIKVLYKACGNDIPGYRDRAMLSIYYGCGLRRTEGIRLNTEDVHLNKSMLFIKKTKTGRQRYVPISESVKNDLTNYINNARIHLIKNKNETGLFISIKGKRMSGTGIMARLKTLLRKAELSEEKIINTGLHTLRHSIATHLLQSGMSLENVSRFLGHQSLESTQIYTHIAYNGKL